MKIFPVILFSILFSAQLFAQEFVKSEILDLPFLEENHSLIEAGEKGLFVIIRLNNRLIPKNNVEFIKSKSKITENTFFYYLCAYNSQLEPTYILEIPVEISSVKSSGELKKMKYMSEQFVYENNQLYIVNLYKGALKITKIDTETKSVSKIEKVLKKDGVVAETYLNDGILTIKASYYYPEINFFVISDMKSIHIINSENFKDKKNLGFGYYNNGNQEQLLVASKAKKGENSKNTLLIEKYNKSGTLSNTFEIQIHKDLLFNTADFFHIKNDSYFIYGLYSLKKNDSESSPIYSNGVYIVKVHNNKVDFLKIYDYADMAELENMTEDKLANKVVDKQEKGKNVSLSLAHVSIGKKLTSLGDNKYFLTLEKGISDPNSFAYANTLIFQDEGTLLFNEAFSSDRECNKFQNNAHAAYFLIKNEHFMFFSNKTKFDVFKVSKNGVKPSGQIFFGEASGKFPSKNSLTYFEKYYIGNGYLLLRWKYFTGLPKMNDSEKMLYFSLYKMN